MISGKIRRAIRCGSAFICAVFAAGTAGAAEKTIFWSHPNTYVDGRAIDGSSTATIETRLYYSFDRNSWTRFASITGGRTAWTGELPAGEGTAAYYAATSLIPSDGRESGFSEIVSYPPFERSTAPAGETTVVLGNCRDTYVDLGSGSGTNFSSDPLVRTYVWPDGNPANRVFLKWDLSALPAGIRVTRARLRMNYVVEEAGGGDNAVVATVSKVVGTDPDIGRATWYSPDSIHPWSGGNDGGKGNLALGESSVAIGKNHGWVEWIVTNMAGEWLASPGTNFGMAIDADGTIDSNRYFASNEYPDPGLRPQLVVTYAPYSPGGAVPSPPGGEGGDTSPPPPGTRPTVSVRNVQDTYLNLGRYSGTNYSSEPFLRTYTWPKGNVANRTLIHWDLSVIPAGVSIEDARLWLYYAGEENGGVDNNYAVTVSTLTGVRPDLDLATWNLRDGTLPWPGGEDGGSSSVALPTSRSVVGTTRQWISWNVTDLVKRWIADHEGNGFMAIEGDPAAAIDSNRYFASGEYPDPDLRPRLHITYTVSP